MIDNINYENEELKEENERLRVVLEKYANKENWVSSYKTWAMAWIFKQSTSGRAINPEPWTVAQEALNGIQTEDS